MSMHMKSFKEYIEQKWNVKVPEGNISGEWFQKNSIPMVVRCSCCDMTMASPSAWVDEDGYTFCGSCANIEED